MELDALREQIEEAANEVYAELGCGREEKIYEEAFAVEFRERLIPYARQEMVEVMYKGHKVGTGVADFVVDRHVVVELKAAASISKSHRSQARAYMRSLGLPDGLIVNLPYPQADAAEVEIVEG